MTKVLLISFFSRSRPGGSYRPAPLAKYLPEFGWEPVILTPFLVGKSDARNLRIIETPYKDVLRPWKKLLRLNLDDGIKGQIEKRLGVASAHSFVDSLLNFGEAFVSYPDVFRGWSRFAFNAGSELLQNEKIDAIISCAPMTSHIVANDLKARYGIPWVADFPDLWSQNHGYSYGPIRHLLDKRLERITLAGADALVTISHPWADKLKKLHKQKRVDVVTHGFDPVEVNDPPTKLTTKFTITYTGLIYAKYQNPSKLFIAVQSLISDGTINPSDVEIRFYGQVQVEGLIETEIKLFNLTGTVTHHGVVPQKVALEKQRESQILLLLDWDDPIEKGVYTSKIFEYLGARRPILATGGSEDDVVDELLKETQAGIHATTVEDIKRVLGELYREYKLEGKVSYRGNEAEVNKYSHREMARIFAGVLDNIVKK